MSTRQALHFPIGPSSKFSSSLIQFLCTKSKYHMPTYYTILVDIRIRISCKQSEKVAKTIALNEILCFAPIIGLA